MSSDECPVLRLRVVADTEPGVIGLVADRFRNLNVLPRRLLAEFGTDDRLHIEVDVGGMTEDQLSLIAKKIAQSPSVHRTHWHPLF
jgi:hypothetical protein